MLFFLCEIAEQNSTRHKRVNIYYFLPTNSEYEERDFLINRNGDKLRIEAKETQQTTVWKFKCIES